jgi:hypothetical protein
MPAVAAPERARRRSSRAVNGATDEVVQPFAVGRVELEQAAEAGVGGLGHELAKLAFKTRRDENGAAAGEGPQRCCGRQSGGGADVYELEAHRGASLVADVLTARPKPRPKAKRPRSEKP